MDEATITNEQKIKAHLVPETGGGNPAQIQPGSATWVVQQGEGTLAPDEGGDELSQWLISGSNPGDTIVLVTADADLGEGVVPITKLLTLHVTGAQATGFGANFDEPVNK